MCVRDLEGRPTTAAFVTMIRTMIAFRIVTERGAAALIMTRTAVQVPRVWVAIVERPLVFRTATMIGAGIK